MPMTRQTGVMQEQSFTSPSSRATSSHRVAHRSIPQSSVDPGGRAMSDQGQHLATDVVVVGAGLGGLAAAASIARTGRGVIVLEHHFVPGGYAHDFRRGHYRFDVSLHAIDGVIPGGLSYPSFRKLGVLDRVHFHRLDPLYVAEFPGRRIVAYADPLAYEAELVRHFPSQRAGNPIPSPMSSRRSIARSFASSTTCRPSLCGRETRSSTSRTRCGP